MIVTRQRKKKHRSLPILLPLSALAVLAIALTWPPSRNVITNSPLKPVAIVFDCIWGTVSRPLSFAYQQQQITDRNRQIKGLNEKLETDRKNQADTDATVAKLRKQIAAAGSQAAPATPAPAPPLAGQPAGALPGAAGAPAQTAASEPIRRAAQQWSAMDPEKAAALVQKLPTSYVSSVFAQMSPDSVGPIMDALPAKVAALIVESNAGPQISAQPSR